ncbi:flagellar export protein FliJ [bacterium]|nr:flagellar export protein FliJ [bacterium]
MPPKRFRYRLDKVLDMKKKKEDDERDKLMQLRREQAQERQFKADREQELVNVHVELKTKRLSGALNIAELRWFPQHIKNLEGKIKHHELRIQELEIKIEEQTQNLAKAMMERKAYEKHKEQSKATFDAEVEAEEARTLDELATLKFARDMAQKAAEEN